MKKILGITAVALCCPMSSFATDMPNIKPGIWEVDVEVDGVSEGKIKQCVDAKTAQNMLTAGQKMLGDRCAEVEIKKVGAEYHSSVSCSLGGSKMDATTKLSGDFDRHYVSETKTTFNPPMMGQDTSISKSDGKWVGPCGADMRPGDTVMPDGRKVNMLDMMKSMPNINELMKLQQGQGAGSQIDVEELKRQLPNLEELQRTMQQGQ